MNLRIHKLATTTPRIRAEIQAAPVSESTNSLAKRYGLNYGTVKRWRGRTTVEDASHQPKRLQTTLTPEQEEVVVEVRRTLLLPIDDLLVVCRRLLCPTLSRSALDRLLRRHAVSRLGDLIPAEEHEPPKRFRQYEPGFVHIDVKYLPRIAGEQERKYLYVAIDRCTRWVYHEVLPDKTSACAAAFLERLVELAPMRLTTVLTDNGSEFSDRFVHGRERTPSGRHAFDRICAKHGIEHRLIAPWHPQTNGMVERYNGRITDQMDRTRFCSSDELEPALRAYREVYVYHIPQRALGHITPHQALLHWFDTRPELFRFDPHNLPGLDSKILHSAPGDGAGEGFARRYVQDDDIAGRASAIPLCLHIAPTRSSS